MDQQHVVYDQGHDDGTLKPTTQSVMTESRMQAALLRENPRIFRKSFLKLYGCIFVGYLCSATNGFDSNTFGMRKSWQGRGWREKAELLIVTRRSLRNSSIHRVLRNQHPQSGPCGSTLRHRKHCGLSLCWTMFRQIWSPSRNGSWLSNLCRRRDTSNRGHKFVNAHGRSFHPWSGSRSRSDCGPELRGRDVIPEVSCAAYGRISSLFLPGYDHINLAGIRSESRKDNSLLPVEASTGYPRSSLCHHSVRYLVHSGKP